MATICPTTEAALQAGLLPAQERRKGHFAKVAGRLKEKFQTAFFYTQSLNEQSLAWQFV